MVSRASQASSSGWLGGFAECIWSSGITSPRPKSRCQTRLTIDRAKKSRSPGWRATSTSLARALNCGGGGGAFVLLRLLEPLLLLLLLGWRQVFRRGVVHLPAGQEHHPGLALDPLGRLELDGAGAALGQEATLAVA